MSAIGFAVAMVGITSPLFASFADFHDVPYRYTSNPARFTSLFTAADSRTVRIAMFGDSQETSPGGAGSVYIPRINYEAVKHYGNAPETPLLGAGSYGGGQPYAEWLGRGAAPDLGKSPSRIAPGRLLPGIDAFSPLNTSGGSNATGQYYGQLTLLDEDATGVNPGTGLPAGTNFFNPSGTVKAQIFAATNSTSGEIAYRALPNTSSTPNFFVPETTTGTLSLGLQSATPGIRSGTTAALDYGGKKYLQLEVAGTSNTAPTDIVGLRFINESHPQGMVFNDFAAGGYQTSQILANHGDSGPLYAALGYDAAIIHTGANDGTRVSAAQFKADTEALIAAIRDWNSDPDYPVILMSDPDRIDMTPAQRAEYDQFVGAQYAIAQSDPNVMLINSRRLMDDLGWNASDPRFSNFVADGVHYTPAGAIALASAEFAAMSVVPEPNLMASVALGALAVLRRSRRCDPTT